MKYDNFRNLPLRKLIHNNFYINLTKFGQMNVRRGKYFFPSSLGWGVVVGLFKS